MRMTLSRPIVHGSFISNLCQGRERQSAISALDAVVQRMEQLLEAVPLPDLPTLEATVVGEVVEVTATGSELEWDLVCRFRDDPASEVTHYEHVWVRDGRCAIPLWRLSGTTFDYQVGFDFGKTGDTVFDRWVSAPLP